MQYEIFDDFKDGMSIVSVPLSWYRRVTEFIKGFGGGGVVKVRSENGAPNVTMDVSISQKANMNTEMIPYKNAQGRPVSGTLFDGDGENTTSWGINEENASDLNGCIVTLPTRFSHPKTTEDPDSPADKSKLRMFFRSFAKSPSGITAAITKEIGYKDIPLAGQDTEPSAQQGADISTDSSGDSFLDQPAFASTLEELSSTWTRGKLDEQNKKVGTKLTICTGIKKHPSQAVYYAHFANLSFDENGMLYKVETAKHSYHV